MSKSGAAKATTSHAANLTANSAKPQTGLESVQECLDQLEGTLAELEQRLKPVLVPKSVTQGVKPAAVQVRAPVADRIGRIDSFVNELMQRIEL